MKGALADLQSAAQDLLEAGRHTGCRHGDQGSHADRTRRPAAPRFPFRGLPARRQFPEARATARTPSHWKRLATTLIAVDDEDAVAVLREAAARQPDDLSLQALLARWFIEQGDAVEAAAHLREEMAGDDPALLLMIAEIQLRGGHENEAATLAQRWHCRGAGARRGRVRSWHARIGVVRDSAWQLVRIAVDAWTEQGELATAAAALQEFVTRVPGWTPALIRLVEIAIDADLAEVASDAQAQLADAYLKSGAVAEALVIIEDLVTTRDRENPAHIERLRQALAALGEPDLEAAIARRLNANLPFVDRSSDH